jgi:hypothetical protein
MTAPTPARNAPRDPARPVMLSPLIMGAV